MGNRWKLNTGAPSDGKFRWWFLRSMPMHDEAGNIVKWYGTAVDIEDRKRGRIPIRRGETNPSNGGYRRSAR